MAIVYIPAHSSYRPVANVPSLASSSDFAPLRTRDLSVRPTQLDHELEAMLEVGEVQDRLWEGRFATHDPKHTPGSSGIASSLLPDNSPHMIAFQARLEF